MTIALQSGFIFGLLAFVILGVTPVSADQSDPSLPQLYADLKQAPNPESASNLENRIWQIWLQAPDDRSSKLLMSTAMAMQLDKNEEALNASTQLTTEYPEFAEGWNKRATVHYLLGNFDESVADIYETLRREPRHFGAISGLGLIFQRKGDLKGALRAFEQVLAISPQSVSARRNLEQIEQAIGKEI